MPIRRQKERKASHEVRRRKMKAGLSPDTLIHCFLPLGFQSKTQKQSPRTGSFLKAAGKEPGMFAWTFLQAFARNVQSNGDCSSLYSGVQLGKERPLIFFINSSPRNSTVGPIAHTLLSHLCSPHTDHLQGTDLGRPFEVTSRANVLRPLFRGLQPCVFKKL